MSEHEKLQTQHGLKYYLSKDIANEIESNNSVTKRTLWYTSGAIIEQAELFPRLLAVVAFFIVTSFRIVGYQVLIGCAIGYIIGRLLNRSTLLFVSPLIKYVMSFYEFITKFFIDILLVILASIFMTHDYVIDSIFIFSIFLMPLFAGTYNSRMKFNNEVAQRILSVAPKKYPFF